MVSINNNIAARAGLRALQSVNVQLAQTEKRISTGYKVSSAADNSQIWKAAQGIRSDLKTYDGVKTSLDFAKSAADFAAAAADNVSSLLSDLSGAISAGLATTSGSAERTASVTKITALQKQIAATIADSTFQGANVIAGDTITYLSSYSNTGTSVSVTTTATDLKTIVTVTDVTLANVTDAPITSIDAAALLADATDAASTITAITTAIGNASTLSANMGAASTSISSNQSILGRLSDIKETALSSLVDADMAEESVRLQALQVKQQLAIQTLSVSNSSAQNILRLFQ